MGENKTNIVIYYTMTKKYKAYKYRLSPTQDQANIMTQWFGAKRFVWNKALALADTRLENGDYIPSFFEFNKMLTLWKQAEEWKFLKEAPKDSIKKICRQIDKYDQRTHRT